MNVNYTTRDNFGMYANSSEGPGPALMGADTLLGSDVYNKDGQDLGDIKERMIDVASGKAWTSGVHTFYGTPYRADQTH